jgi:hypothetical protein
MKKIKGTTRKGTPVGIAGTRLEFELDIFMTGM